MINEYWAVRAASVVNRLLQEGSLIVMIVFPLKADGQEGIEDKIVMGIWSVATNSDGEKLFSSLAP